MLLALPNPTFSAFSINRKFVSLDSPFDCAARSHSTLPSVEALSTTTISCGALGGCFTMLSMHLARRSLLFQLTMIIDKSILFRTINIVNLQSFLKALVDRHGQHQLIQSVQ